MKLILEIDQELLDKQIFNYLDTHKVLLKQAVKEYLIKFNIFEFVKLLNTPEAKQNEVGRGLRSIKAEKLHIIKARGN